MMMLSPSSLPFTHLWLTLREQGEGTRTKAVAVVARVIRAGRRRRRRKGVEDRGAISTEKGGRVKRTRGEGCCCCCCLSCWRDGQATGARGLDRMGGG